MKYYLGCFVAVFFSAITISMAAPDNDALIAKKSRLAGLQRQEG